VKFEKWEIEVFIDIAKRGELTEEGQQNCAKLIEAQQQEIEKLKDDFAALNSLYDAENETFTEIVQKEKELLKEIDQKDTAMERAARGVKSIIEQYTTDFTDEELLSDALCPREKVVLEYANETLEVLQEALGGDTP
jgi:ABC-type transporter Mla subunit MlaD